MFDDAFAGGFGEPIHDHFDTGAAEAELDQVCGVRVCGVGGERWVGVEGAGLGYGCDVVGGDFRGGGCIGGVRGEFCAGGWRVGIRWGGWGGGGVGGGDLLGGGGCGLVAEAEAEEDTGAEEGEADDGGGCGSHKSEAGAGLIWLGLGCG
ncbi:MAG: hypothetical protein RI897_3954 [Verrucomicrobiota bacterium]